MKQRRIAVPGIWSIATLAAAVSLTSVVQAEELGRGFEVSVSGGIHALNSNDTALPETFTDVPVAAAVIYHINRIFAVEGEGAWIIPIKQSVNVGPSGSQDRKNPDLLTYQASVIAKLPVSESPWTPYLTAGAGAATFLSNDDADRLPQLRDSQTVFAINFGAGTTYALASHWAVRADFREFAAFPSNDTQGLSANNHSDTIWQERGTVGLAYRF